ncbi:MAG: Gfo/Idh/MocA family oxidoreductase, partial [Candidatus Hydrogenedentes bacterium]|nr:Gfo/Idh/MocA family oxidoreductase [Candidatus Hydrogenedentota bacterium]
MKKETGVNDSRRGFMRNSAAVVAAATTFHVASGKAFAAGDSNDEILKVGLIGCGGRGYGAIRQAIMADPNARLVALGDTFADRVDGVLNKLTSQGSGIEGRVMVDDDHKFVGFDAYKDVITACDVVVLATPPSFRPVQLKAAIEGDCHVFCEKPIAVDPAGVRSVRETSKLAAKKGLSLVSGLCYRYQFAKQDVIKRIQDGALGKIQTMQTTYNTGALWFHDRQPEWSDMEYQVRNWLYHDWLSGDHINEQHIHSLDKIGWVMGNVYPVKAVSSGGRVVRTDEKYGNIYDHHSIVYEYENGARLFSNCRQQSGCKNNISCYAEGTKGKAEVSERRLQIENGETWKFKDKVKNMYQVEHDELFAGIRSGNPLNNGEYMAKSTLLAIMGRMASYTGQEITWEQAFNSKQDLSPENYAWGP